MCLCGFRIAGGGGFSGGDRDQSSQQQKTMEGDCRCHSVGMFEIIRLFSTNAFVTMLDF